MVSAYPTLLLGTLTGSTMAGVTTGVSQPISRRNYGIVSIYLRSIGTTSGGTILIEEASWMDNELPYSGTWSQIASISASAFTGGAQVAYHVTNSAYGYVRVRIGADITGGGSVAAILESQSGGA